jgi:hypothetical protein
MAGKQKSRRFRAGNALEAIERIVIWEGNDPPDTFILGRATLKL